MSTVIQQKRRTVVGPRKPRTVLLLCMALAGAGSLAWWGHTDILDAFRTPTLSEFHDDLPNIARFEGRILSVQEPEDIEEIMREHRQSIERLSALNERFAVAMHEERFVCAIAPEDVEVFVRIVSDNNRRHRAILETLRTLIIAEIGAQQHRADQLNGGAVRRAIERTIIKLDELLYALSKNRAHAHAVLETLVKLSDRLQSIGRVCRLSTTITSRPGSNAWK